MSDLPASTVRVRDLARRYGAVEALRGVSFEVASGEIYGLLGRNGAGKTTALECVLGLRRPDRGTIEIGGIDALALPGRVKPLVGAQLQAATLQDKITPRQALRLFAAFYTEPANVGELLGRFALAEKADAPFDSLSGGQRQRLFLALAFVNRPRVVVLDEPTAGLDPQARRELHGAIEGLRADGVTVLLSTHDLAEARQLCDRIGILHGGRIVADATPAELVARSHAPTRLAVRAEKLLTPELLAELRGAHDRRTREGGWLLETSDVNQTIAALVQGLAATQNTLLDVQVLRPSLEDVFIELTGQPWAETADRT